MSRKGAKSQTARSQASFDRNEGAKPVLANFREPRRRSGKVSSKRALKSLPRRGRSSPSRSNEKLRPPRCSASSPARPASWSRCSRPCLENATRICAANFGSMLLYEDGSFRARSPSQCARRLLPVIRAPPCARSRSRVAERFASGRPDARRATSRLSRRNIPKEARSRDARRHRTTAGRSAVQGGRS